MTNSIRRFVFVVWTLIALGVTTGGVAASTGDCVVCSGFFDPYSGTAGVECVTPADGDWGSTKCRVTCSNVGLSGGCWCDTTGGSGCLYIVVNG